MMQKNTPFHPNKNNVLLYISIFFLILSGACKHDVQHQQQKKTSKKYHHQPFFSKKESVQKLAIMFHSDNEGNIISRTISNGKSTIGGTAKTLALIESLKKKSAVPRLLLNAGDTFMPSVALKLELNRKNAVTLSNNMLGYKASALGNHEFDFGESFLAKMIKNANYPYLSTTLDFRDGPLEKLYVSEKESLKYGAYLNFYPGKILSSGKICISATPTQDAQGQWQCAGDVIGVIGSTTEKLRTISHISQATGVPNNQEELIQKILKSVDFLKKQKVKVIILLSHLQNIRRDIEIAQYLKDIDIIISGGGDNLIVPNKNYRLHPGHSPDLICKSYGHCYPLLVRNSENKPTLIVSTEGQLSYLGNLEVSFDEEGVLTSYDHKMSRPIPVDDISLQQLSATITKEQQTFEQNIRKQMQPLLKVIVENNVFFDGRKEIIRNRQTNLGDLASDAMFDFSQDSHNWTDESAFAFRNSGSIRAPIGKVDRVSGKFIVEDIRLIDIQASFRFNNEIVQIESTHQAVAETFEAALREAGTARGHFPQVSHNVLLEYDIHGADQQQIQEDGVTLKLACPGTRLLTLQYTDLQGKIHHIVKQGTIIKPHKRIKLLTLDYIADAGDGYFPLKHSIKAINHTKNLKISNKEQDVLINYLGKQQEKGLWLKGQQYSNNKQQYDKTTRIIARNNLHLALPRDCKN